MTAISDTSHIFVNPKNILNKRYTILRCIQMLNYFVITMYTLIIITHFNFYVNCILI